MAEHSQGERAAILAGRYRLGRLIARGGMGEVYEATDRELHRTVAVKVFRSAADGRDRFRIEAVTLAALSHPGLVRVFDAGEHEGDAFVVLEFVDGPTLARRLREQGPVPPHQVAQLGARVADALAHVHEAGVVHRDVTPSNIICGPDGRPKLADFGIARLVDTARVTAPSMAVGTAAYMAPEQVLGEDVTPGADIYSLGLVLLELLTGSRAYGGPSREAAVARLARPPRLPTDLPRDWRRLIRDMTGADASHRPSAPEVRDRLEYLGAARQPASPLVVAPYAAAPAGALGTAPEAATVAIPAVDRTALLPAELIRGTDPGRRRRVPALALLGVVVALGAAAAGLASVSGSDTGRPPPTGSVMSPVSTVPATVPATPPPPPTAPVADAGETAREGVVPADTGGNGSQTGTGKENAQDKGKDKGKEKGNRRGPRR